MLELLIAMITGGIIGYKISQAIHLLSFKKVLEDLGVGQRQLRDLAERNGIEIPEDAAESEPAAEHEIVIEQHGEQLYAYKIDGEFLAQGPDKDALVRRIAERFKNVRFTVTEGQEFLQEKNS